MIAGNLPLQPTDRGFLLGDGIFETLLVGNRTALWREPHLARMENSARELGLPFDSTKINTIIDQLLTRAPPENQVLRVTLSRGTTTRGLAGDGTEPTLLVSLDPFATGLLFQPVRLATCPVRRNQFAPSSRLKTLSCIDAIAAARHAAAQGADDALMLNTNGNIASSTIANIFLLKDDQLITPALDQAILPGIIRSVLLASPNFRMIERIVKPSELATADAVFLTNSLRLIRPVIALDNIPLGTRSLATLIEHLCELARQQCSQDPRLI